MKRFRFICDTCEIYSEYVYFCDADEAEMDHQSEHPDNHVTRILDRILHRNLVDGKWYDSVDGRMVAIVSAQGRAI